MITLPGNQSIKRLELKFRYNRHFFVKHEGTVKYITPIDTGRKLNLHKTFRRRPGRLLNVLCMFNLCGVSTGNTVLITLITKLFGAMLLA